MYAVIDIGSNTIRMVLYKVVNGELRQMLNSKEPAGLVGYVENGKLTGEGIAKLTDTLSHFKLILESVRVKKVLPFATASLRNIENRDEALSAVQKTCGWRVRVLSGLEEAMCDYYGASRLFHTADGLLCDVGGGSTELVFFKDNKVLLARSLPIGSLNMFTAHVRDILPRKKELAEIEAEMNARLAALPLPPEMAGKPLILCGVGGTARALRKVSDKLLGGAEQEGVPCKRITRVRRMLETDREVLKGAVLKCAPDRLHTFLPGTALLEAVARNYGCTEFRVSPYGVREGYLMTNLEGEHD